MVMRTRSVASHIRQMVIRLRQEVMISQYGSGMLQLENAAVYSTVTVTKFMELSFLFKKIKSYLPVVTRQFDYGMWSQEIVAIY
jgi:hypothetical protein